MPASVLLSAGLDALVGEPPGRAHPVVWAGRYLDLVGQRLTSSPAGWAVIGGGIGWTVGGAVAVGVGLFAERVARSVRPASSVLVRGGALWPLWSARLLLREVRAVEQALANSLPEGRDALSRIVSRDTARLSEEETRAAALESLAENFSDSVVAPLFWYTVGGLPAAALYRFSNTADAMWGYRSARWEYAGKVAARVDDVLNLVPARLSALLLRLGADRTAWTGLRAEAHQVASPNAGWPMAALAIRMDLRLSKPGTYVLNPTGRDPQPQDTDAACRLVRRAVLRAVVAAACADHLFRNRSKQPRHRGA